MFVMAIDIATTYSSTAYSPQVGANKHDESIKNYSLLKMMISVTLYTFSIQAQAPCPLGPSTL